MIWHRACLIFLTGFVLLGPSVISAEKASGEIKLKNRDLEKINEQLSRKKEERDTLKKEQKDLSRYLEQSQIKVRDIEQTLLYTREKNLQVEMDMASSKNKKDKMAGDVISQQTTLSGTLQQLTLASAILGPASLTSVYSRQVYSLRSKHVSDLKQQRDMENENFGQLSESFKTMQKQLRKQESSLFDIRSTLKEKERIRQKKLTRQEVLDMELRDLERSKEELASLIENLRTKVAKEAEVEKAARKSKGERGLSPISTHSLPWPMRGTISKKFGRQPQSEFGSSFISNGVVITTRDQGSAAAVANGSVLYAGQFMSYGSMIVVEHPGDWYSVYGFLQKWNVNKGDAVKKGDVLGVASIDPNGGTQIYFELRFYGKPVDPELWMGAPQ